MIKKVISKDSWFMVLEVITLDDVICKRFSFLKYSANLQKHFHYARDQRMIFVKISGQMSLGNKKPYLDNSKYGLGKSLFLIL